MVVFVVLSDVVVVVAVAVVVDVIVVRMCLALVKSSLTLVATHRLVVNFVVFVALSIASSSARHMSSVQPLTTVRTALVSNDDSFRW